MAKTLKDYTKEGNMIVVEIDMCEREIEYYQKKLSEFETELAELKSECLIETGEELDV